ncbi:serine O-acetyltransferase [Ruegeria arenilitoris]|uniref:serine O-acetyltransferase n=1 Tax=Ruegeria arenilitoris TaxID=1173585 RepID=UPI00147D5916
MTDAIENKSQQRPETAFRVFLDDWRRHRPSGIRVMWALSVYRFGRFAAKRQVWLFRKVLGFIYTTIQPTSALLGGLYLERSTKVGEEPHFMHGGNIQINPGSVIGNRVGIMHGVTLGTGPNRENQQRITPVIGDDCFLGCNCSILGGVTIGDRSVVSANSLVISDVPPDSVAIGVPAKVVPKTLFGATK